MQDYLKDIVQHTQALGFIDLVKITGDQNETKLIALAEDKSVVVDAKFKNPVPEFMGTFGMPNLGKLNTILGIPEYKENAKLSITTKKDANGADIPVTGKLATLTPETLEGSNVNAMEVMVKLMDQSRSFEMQVNVIKQNKDVDESGGSMMRASS